MKKKLIIIILSVILTAGSATGIIIATRHKHEYTSKITQPTCTEKGYTTYTCECGDTYVGDYIDELNHDELVHQAQAPTCVDVGWEEYVTCERDGCNYSTYVEIPATGEHIWDDGEVTTLPTCTEKGVKTFTCTVCKTATYTEAVDELNHDDLVHQAQEPTCVDVGWEEYVTCEREGCDYSTYKEISATGVHTWDDGKITTEPTCTEKGVKTFTCTVCKTTTYTEEVPENGHDYEDVVTGPTCEEQGYTTHICYCGYRYIDTYVNISHKFVDREQCSSCGCDYYSEGLTYILSADSTSYIVIDIGSCQDTDLVIPAIYQKKPVVKIESRAFSGGSNIERVLIPNSVTFIGSAAFAGCSSLVEMTLPFAGEKAGVTGSDTYQYPFGYIFGTTRYDGSMGARQAYRGSNISEFTYSYYYIPTSLKKVTINGSYILSGAFSFTNLTNVVIGDNVTSIGDNAFAYCSALSSIVICFPKLQCINKHRDT